MQIGTSPGINPSFDRLSRCPRYVTCFVLSLSPLVQIRSYDQTRLVRLACLNHAASVRSEPGSNSSLGKRLSQDTTHRYWRECDLCFSTNHLAIPAVSSRNRLSSLHARRPKTPALRTHSRFAWARNCSLDKERSGLALPGRQGLYTDTEACQQAFSFFFAFPGPRQYEQRLGSEALVPRGNSLQPIVYIGAEPASRSFFPRRPHNIRFTPPVYSPPVPRMQRITWPHPTPSRYNPHVAPRGAVVESRPQPFNPTGEEDRLCGELTLYPAL